jgi:hypothetical protein
MSLENPMNQAPINNEEIERNPISASESEDFDAEGKPRVRHVMPNGSVEYLSQDEYEAALEGLKDN